MPPNAAPSPAPPTALERRRLALGGGLLAASLSRAADALAEVAVPALLAAVPAAALWLAAAESLRAFLRGVAHARPARARASLGALVGMRAAQCALLAAAAALPGGVSALAYAGAGAAEDWSDAPAGILAVSARTGPSPDRVERLLAAVRSVGAVAGPLVALAVGLLGAGARAWLAFAAAAAGLGLAMTARWVRSFAPKHRAPDPGALPARPSSGPPLPGTGSLSLDLGIRFALVPGAFMLLAALLALQPDHGWTGAAALAAGLWALRRAAWSASRRAWPAGRSSAQSRAALGILGPLAAAWWFHHGASTWIALALVFVADGAGRACFGDGPAHTAPGAPRGPWAPAADGSAWASAAGSAAFGLALFHYGQAWAWGADAACLALAAGAAALRTPAARDWLADL